MSISIEGDFAIGRELMKQNRKNRSKEITRLSKEHDKMYENNTGSPVSTSNKIERLEKSIQFCSVSLTLPAEIDGIIINAKLLQAFMKNLNKDYRTSFTVDEYKLQLDYWNRFKHSDRGNLTLFDISDHFKGYTDIPKLVINNDN